MSEDETEKTGARRRKTDSAARRDYMEILEQEDTRPIVALLQILFPGWSRRDIERAFGDRITWAGIREWRRGRCQPPAWAVDEMQRRATAIARTAALLRPGPTSAAGYKNLNGWKAKQNAGHSAPGTPHNPSRPS